MHENRSTWEILGSLLGLVILIAVLYAAVGYFRAGTSELVEAARVAGRPITLAETLAETSAGEAGDEAVASTEAITATVDVTSSAAITGSAEVTLTAELTTTTAVTETTAAEVAAVITTTDALTESVLTITESPTTTTDVTATQLTTTTSVITAATAISEDGAVLTTTAVVTTTDEPTVTNELTTTAELTATSELTDTEATTVTTAAPEAPAELAAVFLKAGCIGCHVIPGIPNAVGQIGPNLSNIGVDGATRIEGYSSEEYIHESLLEPNAFIAPNCPTGPCLPNLMVQNLGDILTTEELDAIVAYLVTLGTTTQ